MGSQLPSCRSRMALLGLTFFLKMMCGYSYPMDADVFPVVDDNLDGETDAVYHVPVQMMELRNNNLTSTASTVKNIIKKIFGGNKKKEEKKLVGLQRRSMDDVYYHGQVFIGTRKTKKAYNVEFTTSSSRFWVFDESSQSRIKKEEEGDKFKHTFYNQLDSKTYKAYKKEDKVFTETYGNELNYDGLFWGEMVIETVIVGETKLSNFELAVVNSFDDDAITQRDGVFGLGISDVIKPKKFKRNKSKSVVSPFSRLMEKKITGFSFFLDRYSKQGLISFHGPKVRAKEEEELYKPKSLISVPLATETGWIINLEGAQLQGIIGREAVPLLKGNISPVKMHVNIGSKNMWAPRTALDAIVEATEGARWVKDEDGKDEYVVLDDCQSRNAIGATLEFTFNEEKSLTFSPLEYFIPDDVGSDEDVCRLVILPTRGSDDGESWSLGVPFFQKYYTLFDYSKKEISFAVANILDDKNKKKEITWPLLPE